MNTENTVYYFFEGEGMGNSPLTSLLSVRVPLELTCLGMMVHTCKQLRSVTLKKAWRKRSGSPLVEGKLPLKCKFKLLEAWGLGHRVPNTNIPLTNVSIVRL